MKQIILTAALALLTTTATLAEPSVYSPPLAIGSTFTQLSDGTKIHSLDIGSGHTVVLLHGLPASAYLWRKVLPIVSQDYRAVAPDLPGYGHSSAPASGDFGLKASLASLSMFLDNLTAEKITLVVTDMGSVLGLNYAVKHPERIAAIVMSEAVFQPPQEFMQQIRPEHHEFIMAAQDPAFVKQITIDQPALVDMAIQSNTVTTLDEETLSNYRAPYNPPFADHLDKRQTLSAVFGADGLNNFGAMATENADGLKALDIPMLLVVAKPGYMVNEPAIAYAKATFTNIQVKEIDGAAHFFAEDNPEGFANVLTQWLAKNL